MTQNQEKRQPNDQVVVRIIKLEALKQFQNTGRTNDRRYGMKLKSANVRVKKRPKSFLYVEKLPESA